MILFFSGVFATVGIVVLLGATYRLGQVRTPKPNTHINEQDDAQEMRTKQKKMRKAFDNLMSYDMDKAFERKVN